MVAPSFNSFFFKDVLTTDFLALNADGNASSAVVVMTFKLENCDFGYMALHWLHSTLEPKTALGFSKRSPQSKQKINDPTTDMLIRAILDWF